MSQRFVRSITVLSNGEVEVERQIPGSASQIFDLPEIDVIDVNTWVHVSAALRDIVLGFYAGDKSQSEFIGAALYQGFVRDPMVPEFHIAFRGIGDHQFFANFGGVSVDLAARCGLSSVCDLCVDKEQGRLYIGGNTVDGCLPVMVEVDPATALPKQIHKVGERARSVEWSAARDGAVVVVLDDGTVKILKPEGERFLGLPAGKELLAKKVFSGAKGFYFCEVSRDVSSLEVDRDGIELGDSTNILNPDETLLCVTQNGDGQDLLVIVSHEGYTFTPPAA